MMTLPWHRDLSAKGFKHSASRTFVDAGRDSHAGFLRAATGRQLPMSKLGEEAFAYAQDNGISSRSIYDEASELGRHKAVEATEKTVGLTISAVENLTRLNSFMSFVHHLDQSGVYEGNKEGMFQKAEELTNNSMTDYRKGERAMLFDKFGLAGSAASTLQTFKINYFNQLHHFFSEAKKGNWTPLATFLGVQAALGGAVAMPFMGELDDAWEAIRDNLLPDSVHKEVKDFGIKKWLIENLDTWSYGPLSKLTGANMSSRFDAGNVQDFSFDGMFPFVTDLTKQAKAVGSFALNPNETTGAQAAYAVTPTGLQGLLETNTDAFKSGVTPEGKAVYQNPKDLEKHKADFARTHTQELYRKLGLREIEEAKHKEQRFRQEKIEREIDRRRDNANTKFFDAVQRNDNAEARKYAKLYVEYGGNIDSLAESIGQRKIESVVPREVLQKAQANTPGALQKVQRMGE